MRHGSTSSSATPNTSNSAGSGSSSERLQGSEPPPTQRQRVDSNASMAGSQHSSVAPTPISVQNSYDDAGPSPRTLQFDSGSSIEAHHHSRQQPTIRGRSRTDSMHQHLPSLSDMLDSRQKGIGHSAALESLSYPTRPANSSTRTSLDGASVLSGGRTPALRHESSSNGTTTSGSSMGSFVRPPGESPLPIHALLSDRTTPGFSGHEQQPNAILPGAVVSMNKQQPSHVFAQGPSGYGTYRA